MVKRNANNRISSVGSQSSILYEEIFFECAKLNDCCSGPSKCQTLCFDIVLLFELEHQGTMSSLYFDILYYVRIFIPFLIIC